MTVDELKHEVPIIVRKLSKALDEAIKKDEDDGFDSQLIPNVLVSFTGSVFTIFCRSVGLSKEDMLSLAAEMHNEIILGCSNVYDQVDNK